MYSYDSTQKGLNMKFTLIAIASALGIVGVHVIIGWIAYNAPVLTVILLMTGFIGFGLALLNDLGVIKIEMSKLFNSTSR